MYDCARLGVRAVIPVLVLNLPHDAERRRWMDGHLRSLDIPYELVEGVDGRTLPDAVAAPHLRSFSRGYGREMTRGELGCALSHLMLFRRIAAGPDEFVCTMEDDIRVSRAVQPFLDEALLRSLPPFDVLRLFSIENRRCKPAWSIAHMQDRRVVVPLRAGWGTQAQIITRAGAAKMADWNITAPIDGIYHDCPPRELRIMEVRPSLIQRLDHFGSNTAPPRPVRTLGMKLRSEGYRLKRLLLTRTHFVRTWGLPGIVGLSSTSRR
jgi:GR25 family glycosyltransferase involved in LPS biosynthesis